MLVKLRQIANQKLPKELQKKTQAPETEEEAKVDPTVGQVDDVEVNLATEHLDFLKLQLQEIGKLCLYQQKLEGRAIDMANLDLTPTAEELEEMKKEPAYGQPVKFYMEDGCTSATQFWIL